MNVADLVIIVIVVIGFFSGLVRGFVRGLLGLVGLFLGIMLAAAYHQRLADGYLSFVPGQSTPQIIAFVIIFLAVLVIVGILAHIIAKALRLATLGWLDRLLGGVLGAAIASVVVGVILLLAVMGGLQDRKALVESSMAPRILSVTDVVVSLLPAEAKAKVEEEYGKLRGEWEKAQKRKENVV